MSEDIGKVTPAMRRARIRDLSWGLRVWRKENTPGAWARSSEPSPAAEQLLPGDVLRLPAASGLNGRWLAVSSWRVLGVTRNIAPLRIACHAYIVGRYFAAALTQSPGCSTSTGERRADQLRFAAPPAGAGERPELGARERLQLTSEGVERVSEGACTPTPGHSGHRCCTPGARPQQHHCLLPWRCSGIWWLPVQSNGVPVCSPDP